MIISIIIPVYNVEQFVEKCVLSCLKQDIKASDYEIICVNDGSKDNSLSIVEGIASRYKNVKVVSQLNRGLSAARNTGMRYAQGDYYMFVDSDDWIEENCLGKLVHKLNEEEPDCLTICAANVINGVPIRRISYLDENPISGKELMRRGVEPCAPFSLWNGSFLKKNNLNFYEGIFHEDSEFTPRAYYYASKVSFTNDIIYYVYQNPNSITRSVNPQKSFDLVNVVCKNLSNFVSEVDPDDRYVFHNLVSLYLNNAMANILQSDMDKQMELNDVIRSNKGLWKNLRSSTILKYKVEGWLFRMFGNPLRIYRILQFFNKNKKIL